MKIEYLENVCDILDSQRVPITASERTSGNYPYYGANGIQDYVNDYIFDDELVLLAEDGGNFGSKTRPIAYRVSGKCWVNNHAHVLKPKDCINVDYLCYALMFYNTAGIVNGATRQKLTQASMRKMKIPLVDMCEQIKIVEKLNNLVNLKENINNQIKKYDDLVKSQFIEMFGDPDLSQQKESWDELENVGEIVGGSTPKTSIKEYWDGDLNWFTPAEIKENDFIVNQSERKITELGAKSCSLRKMPINTVILSSRAPIGKVALAGCEFYCNQGFKNIICNENLNPIFLLMLLKYNNEYLNSLGRGATFKEISKTIVSKIKIPTPPIELQNQFADFVKHIDKLKYNDVLMEVA